MQREEHALTDNAEFLKVRGPNYPVVGTHEEENEGGTYIPP